MKDTTLAKSNLKNIYPNIKIGKNVTIGEGTVIGSDGMRFTRNERGELSDCGDHYGGVLIGNDVWIGCNTSIQQGELLPTIIGNRTKIGHNCVIGHETIIGKDCLIISGAIIGGYCRIEDYARISLGAIIRNRVVIGKGAQIGMGAVVTKDVPDYNTVYGNPAELHNYIK